MNAPGHEERQDDTNCGAGKRGQVAKSKQPLGPLRAPIKGIRNLVWVSGFMAVVALISKDGF